MNLFAKDQPAREYQAPSTDEKSYASRVISIGFNAGKYTVSRDAGMDRETVKSGPICPEVQGSDSREARAIRRVWMDEKVESVRKVAQAEKLLFVPGRGFSRTDYR